VWWVTEDTEITQSFGRTKLWSWGSGDWRARLARRATGRWS